MDDFKPGPARTRSKAVSTLAVVNLILGGIRLVLSVLPILLLVLVLNEGPAASPDFLNLIGFIELLRLWAVLLIFAIFSIVAGLVLIVAGMGLWQGRRCSRIIT